MEPAERLQRAAEVPPELAGERADKVAAILFDEFSRALLSRWIGEGALTVNGASVKPKTRLIGGESLALDVVAEPIEDWASGQPVEFTVACDGHHLRDAIYHPHLQTRRSGRAKNPN